MVPDIKEFGADLKASRLADLGNGEVLVNPHVPVVQTKAALHVAGQITESSEGGNGVGCAIKAQQSIHAGVQFGRWHTRRIAALPARTYFGNVARSRNTQREAGDHG